MPVPLTTIITKVRRLTRSPSENQISTPTIIDYINDFLLYNFPEHLRQWNYHETFSFTCNPYQDFYPTNIINPAYEFTNPLWNFNNQYLSVNPPLYIAGFEQQYLQSRSQFFAIYPKIQSINQFAFGDGVTARFTGQINTAQTIIAPGQVVQNAVLQGHVLFSSTDSNLNGLAMYDIPVVDTLTGNPTVNGNLYPVPFVPPINPPTVIDPNNTINYSTGVFTVTFQDASEAAVAPGPNLPISSQSVNVQLARPQAMLFYDNGFTLRPVPDQPYTIEFEVYKRPIALDLAINPYPDLDEYWMYIAYGAARLVLQDRMDIDTVALIDPEWNLQQRLILRRTIKQNSTQRVGTIYSDNATGGSLYGWGWGGGQF